MTRSLREIGLVLAVAGVAFFTNLGGPRLWDRDEPRNAGCAAEMLAANDWVTPVFNAELRSHKPVLTYWFMMASYAVLGVNEFSARLPSAIYGIGTCLLVWHMGRRLFGQSAGTWSAVVLATTLMFGVASRAATPDAPLVFFSTLAMAIYVLGVTNAPAAGGATGIVRDFPERWPTIAAMYGAMGMAVLAKGPIGLVLPTAVIGMFLLIRRLPERSQPPVTPGSRLLSLLRPFAPWHFLKTCWAMKPVTALLVAGAVALPWYVWVHLRTDGAWTYNFFLQHNVGRAMEAMDGHNGGPAFYPVALLAGFFPWSIFWLPVVIHAVRRCRREPNQAAGELLLLCWVGVYLGLFTIAKTKLPSYITPCYPGLALLTGVFLDRWTRGDLPLPAIWNRLAFGSLILVGVAMAAALPVAASMFLPGEELLGLAGAIPIVGGLIAWQLAERSQQSRSAQAMAATALVFSVGLFAVVSQRIDAHRHLEDLVDAVYDAREPQEVELASLSSVEASWVFYCRQPITPFYNADDALTFLQTPSPSGRQRVLISTDAAMQKFLGKTTVEGCSTETVPYFLEDETIVILERTQDAPQMAGRPR